jgi:Flp pilus assembly protein TadG
MPRRRATAQARGETLIEFALSLTLFFAAVFGTIGFGLAVWRYNMVSNLAQEGARWAAVHAKNSGSPKTAGDIEAYVQARAVGLPVTVPSPPTSDPSTLVAGQSVTVKVQTTFRPFTRLIPAPSMTLHSTAQMIVTR